ncbi:hypothetical protein Ddc_05537 [Ditylenchus destructor]|nr:hypothetical protein Ddc_05537 [Ditylenchus destructor]
MPANKPIESWFTRNRDISKTKHCPARQQIGNGNHRQPGVNNGRGIQERDDHSSPSAKWLRSCWASPRLYRHRVGEMAGQVVILRRCDLRKVFINSPFRSRSAITLRSAKKARATKIIFKKRAILEVRQKES